MRNKTIVMVLMGMRLGFWLSVARELNTTHKVVILTRRGLEGHIEKAIPGGYEALETVEDHHESYRVPEHGALAEALRLERTYGERMSLVMSNRRDLGKGYLYNADAHPDMASSWWSHENKLAEIQRTFFMVESVLDAYKPVLVIEESCTLEVELVARNRGILNLSLGIMKYGNLQYWVETTQYTSSKYVEAVRRAVAKWMQADDVPDVEYEQEQATKYLDSLLRFTWKPTLKTAAKAVFSQTRHQIKRMLMAMAGRPLPPRDGYGYLGWLPCILRRPLLFDYLKRHGRKPDDLAGYTLFYFPLHLEPENALMRVSPEFGNSLELATLVSKSLPADALLVVKENMNALGVRSSTYYDFLRRMPNVVLAHPDITSWEWIRRSKATVTITGTAAVEAVYFERPVLSFGKHQIVNELPSARYANNYESTRKGVEDLLAMAEGERILKVARAALCEAQKEVSFELPGAHYHYVEKSLDPAGAKIAVEDLFRRYTF